MIQGSLMATDLQLRMRCRQADLDLPAVEANLIVHALPPHARVRALPDENKFLSCFGSPRLVAPFKGQDREAKTKRKSTMGFRAGTGNATN